MGVACALGAPGTWVWGKGPRRSARGESEGLGKVWLREVWDKRERNDNDNIFFSLSSAVGSSWVHSVPPGREKPSSNSISSGILCVVCGGPGTFCTSGGIPTVPPGVAHLREVCGGDRGGSAVCFETVDITTEEIGWCMFM